MKEGRRGQKLFYKKNPDDMREKEDKEGKGTRVGRKTYPLSRRLACGTLVAPASGLPSPCPVLGKKKKKRERERK